VSAFPRVLVEQKCGDTSELRMNAPVVPGEEILDAGFDTAGQAEGVLDQQAHGPATAATPVSGVPGTRPADPAAVGVESDERPDLTAPGAEGGSASQLPVTGPADGTDW